MNFTKTLFNMLVLLSVASLAQASTVLFNFGGTTYAGINAPGHVDGAATGTTWNTLAVDTGSGILDENGAATTVVVDFGTSAGGGTTVDYAGATKNADYDTYGGVNATIFQTTLMEGNAVRDSGSLEGIALNVSGLAAGSYEFYFTALRAETSSNAVRTHNVFAGVAADAITDFSSLSVGTLTNVGFGTASTPWTEGTNYIKGQFTIDGTQNFSLLTTSPDYIGVMSSLEIVAIPEASSLMLSLFAFVALGVCCRRKV
ncbi:hypothetical protein P3T73_04755 [Kiritimatiellota bacterium B12222]|nr:hypothetical protein P3T73_04755 [Kiritimatiellota bacterium B12222]